MALPEQEMPGRFAARSGILSPAPPFTTVPRRHRRRSSFAARAVRHLPAALPFAHRSPDRTTATHAGRGPPAPTTEKKGFGAFAHTRSRVSVPKPPSARGPSRSARVVEHGTVHGRLSKDGPRVKSQAKCPCRDGPACFENGRGRPPGAPTEAASAVRASLQGATVGGAFGYPGPHWSAGSRHQA